MVIELFETDLAEIINLEKIAFPPGMQARGEVYQQRFDLGHIVLGYYLNGLCGIISFSYGIFDPDDPTTIPENFKSWSTQKVPAGFNTAFIYNLGLTPDIRGTKAGKALVTGALTRAIADGCHQAIGEGPIPSYAGNNHVKCNLETRKALDEFAAGGNPPLAAQLFKDPHLAFYRRLCPCSIVRVMSNFLPADTASGGFRAMLFRNLKDFSSMPEEIPMDGHFTRQDFVLEAK